MSRSTEPSEAARCWEAWLAYAHGAAELPQEAIDWVARALVLHFHDQGDLSDLLGLTGGKGRSLRTRMVIQVRDMKLTYAWIALARSMPEAADAAVTDALAVMVQNHQPAYWRALEAGERPVRVNGTDVLRHLAAAIAVGVKLPTSPKQIGRIVKQNLDYMDMGG